MKTKKIYQKLFPGLSYENEPWMDSIWLSFGVVCLLIAVGAILGANGIG